MDWPYHLIDVEEFRGAIVTPPGSEPLIFSFAPSGRLAVPWYGPRQQEWIFTKTQYAGMDAHMAMIRLCRYISEKFLERFELRDEGGYWEADDEVALRSNWARHEQALDAVAEALGAFPARQGERAASLAAWLEAYLRERLSGPA